ncbi:MFS transporter [Streptobacillus moniliformis]|uniref:Major facilitator superfamily MFS_1 n=1 Tax=Streptobacillus moniliformis (strain ATCC 14647 / DSM 12112 / NCTC 10651 / 9901) TaxID=519441 RepID=D1AXJ7_STRM9|nr:MFS transporter [Streptobacillus moniliformis]ACZ01023.1 major facilitator superfamily MFS_1 [Streptobacillus moniliformis DSM 12112]AVL42606.1 MFS transporter [Streptobacillus moniliformis]SQA13838.1 putative 3-phenylpropionic acid transporter [Streptobacillus moniliformis]
MTKKYTLMQILYWAMFSSVYAFANSFLSSRGFNSTLIGTVMALSALFSVLLQPLTARLIEVYKKITVKNSLIASMLLVLLNALLISYFDDKILVSIFFIILITGLLNAQTYMYTFIFQYINKGENVNFGIARGMGSAAFAISSYFYGLLGSKIGFEFIPICATILSLFVIFVIMSFKDIKKETLNNETEIKANFLEFFNKYKRFCYVLLGMIFIFFTHTVINTFMRNILESLGRGAEEVGIGFMIAAVVELPVMFYIVKLNKKFGYSKLLKISAIAFLTKITITYVTILTGNITLFYIAQITQFAGYAIYVPVSVYYTNHIMEEKDRIKGQAYMAVSATIGSILGNLIGGKIIEIYSLNSMILASLIATIIGAVILMLNLEDK